MEFLSLHPRVMTTPFKTHSKPQGFTQTRSIGQNPYEQAIIFKDFKERINRLQMIFNSRTPPPLMSYDSGSLNKAHVDSPRDNDLSSSKKFLHGPPPLVNCESSEKPTGLNILLPEDCEAKTPSLPFLLPSSPVPTSRESRLFEPNSDDFKGYEMELDSLSTPKKQVGYPLRFNKHSSRPEESNFPFREEKEPRGPISTNITGRMFDPPPIKHEKPQSSLSNLFTLSDHSPPDKQEVNFFRLSDNPLPVEQKDPYLTLSDHPSPIRQENSIPSFGQWENSTFVLPQIGRRRISRMDVECNMEKRRSYSACTRCKASKRKCDLRYANGGKCSQCKKARKDVECIAQTKPLTIKQRTILSGSICADTNVKKLADKDNKHRGQQCLRNPACSRPLKHPGHCKIPKIKQYIY
eukprot:jgi/Bigna1/85476/estExt_fgenesh1_pg.C_40171